MVNKNYNLTALQDEAEVADCQPHSEQFSIEGAVFTLSGDQLAAEKGERLQGGLLTRRIVNPLLQHSQKYRL